MNKCIKVHRRPEETQEILQIIRLLTPMWFTQNVFEDTRKDLTFQDAICLQINDELMSFIIFTCWEGTIYITLMATHPDYQGRGYGSELVTAFFEHVQELGFNEIKLLTVPQEVKPIYEKTITFYKKQGFNISRRYSEIWGSGAIELTIQLKQR
ncbi:Acetyltransferase (GNAT) domain-containing protein [Paenibacillus sp. 1_12]|uniref:GNAT family N-acetyltransferase n=1 Tax=Paenibacillus sp. 1_12 TaxID=1566278 RepID=UPI0008F0F730|nr:GNAT family N-acetyltransferase [Paenibacillus sp. 1_12]SFM36368.1 Acetyltransferase (GNAT) domain-containing protein [Paenibacillus sp. 1_12]